MTDDQKPAEAPAEGASPSPTDKEADEARKRIMRANLAIEVAEILAPPVAAWMKHYGPKLTINALLDLACGAASNLFDPEQLPGILQEMAQRVADTDWQRHRARADASRKQHIQVVKPAIVLPK